MSEKQPQSMEVGTDTHKELISGLRERGIEDAAVREALNAWTLEQEEKVEAAGRTPEARIGFEIDRVRLYAEGEYIALYVAQ